jgi:hypothetical protein
VRVLRLTVQQATKTDSQWQDYMDLMHTHKCLYRKQSLPLCGRLLVCAYMVPKDGNGHFNVCAIFHLLERLHYVSIFPYSNKYDKIKDETNK